jgi:DNA-binding SARP family transcriptional activator
VADELCRRGDCGKACDALEKVLAFDPCEEEAVTRLIQLKRRSGDTAAAIRFYRTYEKRLKDELGLLPSEKVKAMFPAG